MPLPLLASLRQFTLWWGSLRILHMVRVAVALFMLVVASSVAQAEKRVALIIGNSAYQHSPELSNPRNDAQDFAAALRTLGIEVIEGLDLDKQAMDREVRKFSAALSGADVGIF